MRCSEKGMTGGRARGSSSASQTMAPGSAQLLQDRQEPRVEVDLGCETGGRRNVRSEFLADLRVGQRREDARAPQHIAREGRQDASEHRCGQRKLATHDQDEQLG